MLIIIIKGKNLRKFTKAKTAPTCENPPKTILEEGMPLETSFSTKE